MPWGCLAADWPRLPRHLLPMSPVAVQDAPRSLGQVVMAASPRHLRRRLPQRGQSQHLHNSSRACQRLRSRQHNHPLQQKRLYMLGLLGDLGHQEGACATMLSTFLPQ